jgi:hypothetical protein
VPLVLAAAIPIALAPRAARAQSRNGSAPLSVSVTVVRSCLVDTSAGGGAGVTCGQTTSSSRLQSLAGATTPSVAGTPNSPHIVTSTADGRVVIEF